MSKIPVQSRLEKDMILSVKMRLQTIYDDLVSLEDHFFSHQDIKAESCKEMIVNCANTEDSVRHYIKENKITI